MGELIQSGMTLGSGGVSRGHALLRLLKKPFFGRFMKPWRWPEGVVRDGWNQAEIVSRNGARLQALVRRTHAPARGVVVLAHPMGLAAKGFWLKYGHAEAFVARGYHVVAFDFNGFGESESTSFDYPGDLIAAGLFARRTFSGVRVFAVGASFGAMRALEAMSEPAQPFDGVVAEAAAPTLPDFWKHYPLPYLMLQASRWVYPAWERRLRPAHLLAQAQNPPPLLLIHSAADRWTPPEFGDRIERIVKSRGRVERLIVGAAEHTHVFRDARDSYTNTVFAFLDSL